MVQATETMCSGLIAFAVWTARDIPKPEAQTTEAISGFSGVACASGFAFLALSDSVRGVC